MDATEAELTEEDTTYILELFAIPHITVIVKGATPICAPTLHAALQGSTLVSRLPCGASIT